MKFRHVAALALTGWYLMLPPDRLAQEGALFLYTDNRDAPLTEWLVVQSFDTAAHCEAKRKADFTNADRQTREFAISKHADRDFAADRQALSLTVLKKGERCGATDDPRLKEDAITLHPGISG